MSAFCINLECVWKNVQIEISAVDLWPWWESMIDVPPHPFLSIHHSQWLSLHLYPLTAINTKMRTNLVITVWFIGIILPAYLYGSSTKQKNSKHMPMFVHFWRLLVSDLSKGHCQGHTFLWHHKALVTRLTLQHVNEMDHYISVKANINI